MIAIGLGPSLARGASPRAGFDFTAGALPPGARLTRASIGSRFDAAGVMRIEAADVPRFDHDPATGALRGLLIEPERTNEAVRSAALDDVSWTGGGATVDAAAAMAPDGTMTADAVRDLSTTGLRFVTQAFGQAASRTISIFVAKDATARASRFMMFRATIGLTDLIVDTATGTVASAGAIADGRAQDCGGFWRLSSRCDSADQIRFFPAAGAGALSPDQYRVDTTGTVVAWGFQAERGAGATSYIPTDGAPATRAADVLTLDWGRLGVADGPLGVRTVFDDGSVQESEIAVADGRTIVPTDLARPWLRRIERR